MGRSRNNYAQGVRVSVGPQGQRRTYYDHDRPESSESSSQPQQRGGGVNRVWRRGDQRRVSFNDRGRGVIMKKGRGGNRPIVRTSRVHAILEERDEDMQQRGGPSIRAGRARPESRGMRKSWQRGRGGRIPYDHGSRFQKLSPLSDDNKTKIQEAMNKNYNQGTKALNLTNFGADATFGGSSGATGKLTDSRVVECVIDTIGQHLADLEAICLENNNLRSLRSFAKLAEKAQNIKTLWLQQNKLAHSKELDVVSGLKLVDLKLEGNPFLSNFKDGNQYKSIMQKKFKTLQSLDGQELPKLITFEDDDEGTSRPKTVNLPNHIKMVVNDQVGDFIGKFLEQYFKVYDSDNREQLSMAYHEEAMMSMSASFQRNAQDESTQSYKEESRNLRLDFIRENVNRRDRHLHQKRLQIVGFLDKLPKTQHDLTSFTLDVPFATERLVTFTVSGAFRERLAAAAGASASTIPAVRHFNRMFVVVPQGEGLCIINDSLFVTGATREQSERTNTLFTLSQQTGMNLHWSNICLTDQG